MNKNNLLILIFFLLFFFPDIGSQTNTKADEKLDVYTAAQYEGYVAYLVTEDTQMPVVPPDNNNLNTDKNLCECNGTKKISTGDGRVFPCPCGANCPCKKVQGAEPILPEMAPDVPKIEDPLKKKDNAHVTLPAITEKDAIEQLTGVTCVFFTDPTWCPWCVQLEKTTFPEMRKAGYRIVEGLDSKAHICLLDDEHPLSAKYGKGLYPCFVIMKDGVIKEQFTGFISAVDLSNKIIKVNNTP